MLNIIDRQAGAISNSLGRDDVFEFCNPYVVIKSDTSGIGVSVRYDIPVSSVFDIYAKLGLLRWDFEQTSTATGVASQTVSESGTDTIFGIGVNFAASDQFSIFVDYEMTEVDNDDTTVLGAGVAVNF